VALPQEARAAKNLARELFACVLESIIDSASHAGRFSHAKKPVAGPLR
jgi:hypothetical protein